MTQEQLNALHPMLRALHAAAARTELTAEEAAAVESAIWLFSTAWAELPADSNAFEKLAEHYEHELYRLRFRRWAGSEPPTSKPNQTGNGERHTDGVRPEAKSAVTLNELDFRCRRCGSRPGVRCTSDSGNFTRPHKKRRNDLEKSLNH